MPEDLNRIIRLPVDWTDQAAEIAGAGLEPLRVISARIGVDRGEYSDECEYAPDPEVWRYYRQMAGPS